MSVTPSPRLAHLPRPPRSAPIRRRKPVGRAGSGRLIYIDKETAGSMADVNGSLPRVSDMLLHFPVLVIGSGVPAFKVERVSAALKARGVRGYWLVERQERARAQAVKLLAETLVGFPGLHIARIGSLKNFWGR